MPSNLNPNHRLKYEREQRGWSQARVAEQIGTEAVNVSRWERGFSSPSPYYREKLCNLFEKNAQDLGFLAQEDRVDKKEPIENPPDIPVKTDLSYPEGDQFTAAVPPEREVPSLRVSASLSGSQTARKLSLPSRRARILATLSYLFWWASGLPILLFNSQDDFVLFHSLQSVLWFGVITLLEGVCLWLMDLPLSDTALLPFVLFFIVLNVVALPTWIVQIVRAWRGSYGRLPFVGEVSEKLASEMIRRGRASNSG